MLDLRFSDYVLGFILHSIMHVAFIEMFLLSLFLGNLVLDIFRAPIQVVIGLLYGIIFGLLLWVLPTKHFVNQFNELS